MWVIFLQFFYVFYTCSLIFSGITQVCNMETYEHTCRPGEVILMESTRYGRMRLGRCMSVDHGSLGCSVDVLRFSDALCSGRNQCSFKVRNSRDGRRCEVICFMGQCGEYMDVIRYWCYIQTTLLLWGCTCMLLCMGYFVVAQMQRGDVERWMLIVIIV